MIRTYIHIFLFAAGLIYLIVERVAFERKNKGKEPNEYMALFRKHNFLMFLFFFVLLILQICKLFE